MTQAQMARELGLSRSTVNDNVQAGMPLTCTAAAIAWRKERGKSRWHFKGTKFALPTLPPPPPRDPRQGDPNWKMTVEETVEVVQTLKDMKAQGCSEETHPRYQAFCDGVRLFHDRGVDLTPEQWELVRG